MANKTSKLAGGGLTETIFQNFRGLNRRSDRLNSSPEFLYDLRNGYIKKDARTELGVIIQRDGLTKLNSTVLGSDYGSTKTVRYIYEAKWNGGSSDVIIRAGSAWGRYSTNAFTAFDTARTNDVMGQAVMFKNQLIYVDGAKPRKMTSGYTVTDLSVDGACPTDSTAVWVHRDKVWLNSIANPMIAYFSMTNAANGATSWSAANDAGFLDLSTVLPEGDTIRGFRTYGGVDSGILAVICDKYTVLYQAGADVNEFTFVQYFATTCVSINALDYIGRDITYPSRNVFTTFQSTYNLNNIEAHTLSEFVEPLYRQLVAGVTNTQNIVGCFDRVLNLYYLCFPSTTDPKIFVYSADIKNFVGQWSYSGITPTAIRQKTDGTMLLGGSGYVYTMNSGTTDDGVAISFKAATPALYLGSASVNKAVRQFEMLIQNNGTCLVNVDYWYSIDIISPPKYNFSFTLSSIQYLWNVALWNVSYWLTGGQVVYRNTGLFGRGKSITIEIRQADLGAKITIPYFILRYNIEGIL